MSRRALLVIDLQNDYFPGGKFPLWNPDVTLERTLQAIGRAQVQGIPVILVQHVADSRRGPAPFFAEGSEGVQLHSRLRAAVPDAPVVVKAYADSFHETKLEETLAAMGITELLVCGMMTQNCVTHTAISKSAEKYRVSVLGDCCTTVSEPLHLIALNAVSTRLSVLSATEALG
ncbi:cysteine hydrolase family protein [Geothrix sp. PMB-07]|uniref:cysteine hydrolase family protein n=1 Tax=Geothrix sp. PMB-07 TaxID=3068640 RepID=UPI0027406933|nr:cysteine hydrolase family protein [Geothrix sp. PMB-07]WLT30813.1 cysteine hydrolase family protein [Geothrix sp. PMB-07]